MCGGVPIVTAVKSRTTSCRARMPRRAVERRVNLAGRTRARYARTRARGTRGRDVTRTGDTVCGEPAAHEMDSRCIARLNARDPRISTSKLIFWATEREEYFQIRWLTSGENADRMFNRDNGVLSYSGSSRQQENVCTSTCNNLNS